MAALNFAYFTIQPNAKADATIDRAGKCVPQGKARDRLKIQPQDNAHLWIGIERKVSGVRHFEGKPIVRSEDGEYLLLSSTSLQKRLHLTQVEIEEGIAKDNLEALLLATCKKINLRLAGVIKFLCHSRELGLGFTPADIIKPLIFMESVPMHHSVLHPIKEDPYIFNIDTHETIRVDYVHPATEEGLFASIHPLESILGGPSIFKKGKPPFIPNLNTEFIALLNFSGLWGIQKHPLDKVYDTDKKLIGFIQHKSPENLSQFMQRHKNFSSFRHSAIEQLLHGLKAVHSKGFAHSQITAENISVESIEEEVVFQLSNFGFAVNRELGDFLCMFTLTSEEEYKQRVQEADRQAAVQKEQKRDILNLGMIFYYFFALKSPFQWVVNFLDYKTYARLPLQGPVGGLIHDMLNPNPALRPTAAEAYTIALAHAEKECPQFPKLSTIKKQYFRSEEEKEHVFHNPI